MLAIHAAVNHSLKVLLTKNWNPWMIVRFI